MIYNLKFIIITYRYSVPIADAHAQIDGGTHVIGDIIFTNVKHLYTVNKNDMRKSFLITSSGFSRWHQHLLTVFFFKLFFIPHTRKYINARTRTARTNT